MCIRHIKRKCSVRGCKNTDSFAISQNREIGNTVIICKKCLEDAISAIDGLPPNKKTNVEKQPAGQLPPLFYNNFALAKPKRTAKAEKNIEKEKES